MTTRRDWALWSKPPTARHRGIERALARMAERRMAEIMRQRQRLGQVLVDAKRAGDGAGDLRHFEAMGQPRAVMIALVIDEHLGLVVQPAEGRGMEDAVAVARERRAGSGSAARVKPPAARPRIDGIRRQPRAGAQNLAPFAGKSPRLRLWSIDKRVRHPVFQAGDWLHPNERTVHHLERASGAPDCRAYQGRAGPRRCFAWRRRRRLLGLPYRFDLVTEPAPDDLLIERDGARVVVDPVSLDFVPGAELDFVDDLIGAQFKIKNPNVTASCGCGTSFSV